VKRSAIPSSLEEFSRNYFVNEIASPQQFPTIPCSRHVSASKGTELQHPGWVDTVVGFQPFPTTIPKTCPLCRHLSH
jgi:hypothetical protein